MTNEEKAIELAENISPYDIGGDNAAHYAAKDTALEAMEWKDAYYKKLLDLLVESGADADIITNYIKNCIEL